MRRATVTEYNKLADKLSNLVGAMNIYFKDLCVKAEPVALLNVRPVIEGEATKLEDCAKMGKEDDYTFILVPEFDDDIPFIQKAIMQVHPEFKIDLEQVGVDYVDDDGADKHSTVNWIKVTMPEVNDDRYDLLKDGVKLLYDNCKTQMEVANATSKPKFAELAMGESKENLELLDKELDKLNKQWNEQRDNLRDAKLQEIEDAHNKWLAEKAAAEQAQQERDAALGEDVKSSMKYEQ